MKNLQYIIFVILLFFACNRKAADSNTQEDKALPIGKWVVQSLQLKDKKLITPQKSYLLTIEADKLRLSLDVNTCRNTYSVEKDSLITNQFMVCTEACCDHKSGQAVALFLTGSLHYELKEDALYLSNEKGTLTLAKPVSDLVGSDWKAISYTSIEGDKKHTKFSNPYILSFDEKNIVLKLDANNCFGAVSFTKNSFETQEHLGCSRKCCDSEDGVLLSKMLTGKNTYAIEKEQMIVTTDKYTIIFQQDFSTTED